MRKQVLILNITRMGDLVQTVPLLARLEQEWPGVAIDLVVDTRCAPVAAVLPGFRSIHVYDFTGAFKPAPDDRQEYVPLSPDIVAWAQSLATIGYDRVINLTFTRWSGVLAEAIGAPDTRGAVTVKGISILKNDWLAYIVDMHRFRRVNRFNVADLFALGGSGPGRWMPIHLVIPPHAAQWAEEWLQSNCIGRIPVAVQVGASHVRKAWRPEYFGRTMAVLSRQAAVAFVLIGTADEGESAGRALAAFRAAGGTGEVCNAVGQTDVAQLAALLKRCRLVLTNDTGPMHLAVGGGTPVINFSMGHVDFRETGPYGPGHWVIQPDIACGPCELNQACVACACKDQIVPEQVAALGMHVLGLGPFPERWSGVRVFESAVDTEGLVTYHQRAGRRDAVADWYACFWRHHWHEEFTGEAGRVTVERAPGDVSAQLERVHQIVPRVDRMVLCAERLRDLCHEPSVTQAMLKAAQDELIRERQQVMPLAMQSPLCGPITVALVRKLYDGRALRGKARAEQQAHAYSVWRGQMQSVIEQLSSCAVIAR